MRRCRFPEHAESPTLTDTTRAGHCLLRTKNFSWPNAPLLEGGKVDLTRPFLRQGLGFVVAVLLDKKKSVGFVAAVNRKLGLLIAYCFKRSDFPWVAIWEENMGIAAPPWKQRTRARGLEFSTTPLPVLRRDAFLSRTTFRRTHYDLRACHGQQDRSLRGVARESSCGFRQCHRHRSGGQSSIDSGKLQKRADRGEGLWHPGNIGLVLLHITRSISDSKR